LKWVSKRADLTVDSSVEKWVLLRVDLMAESTAVTRVDQLDFGLVDSLADWLAMLMAVTRVEYSVDLTAGVMGLPWVDWTDETRADSTAE
jgi:hypothetical protein